MEQAQALNNQLVYLTNKVTQVKQMVSDQQKGPQEAQEPSPNQLALNNEDVLVEKPPFQSKKFEDLPDEPDKIHPSYEFSIIPKDKYGEPLKINICLKCTQMHPESQCWMYEEKRGTRQCAHCKGFHQGPCKPWVKINPNRKN
jgi:hypothetical protein